MSLRVSNAFKRLVVEGGREMMKMGFTVGTWGNISVRDPETGYIYIKPSGIDYNRITEDDVVVLDSRAEVIEGTRKPSIEKYMHVGIMNARKDVNAVIHTHPVYSSVLGVNRMELPGISEDFVQIVGEKMTLSDYALPGTRELADNVVKALGPRNAVMIPNHGTVAVGPDLGTALKVCQVVEKTAQIYILARSIGTPHCISSEDIRAMQEFVRTSYGQ
jgi:L-fuculose-phosphate aldolase